MDRKLEICYYTEKYIFCSPWNMVDWFVWNFQHTQMQLGIALYPNIINQILSMRAPILMVELDLEFNLLATLNVTIKTVKGLFYRHSA